LDSFIATLKKLQNKV